MEKVGLKKVDDNLIFGAGGEITAGQKAQIPSMTADITHTIQDEVLLDLCYEEDSNCQTDLNVVMTQAGEFIEIQGTAEDKPFTRAQSNAMLEMAEKGIAELIKKQQEALGW